MSAFDEGGTKWTDYSPVEEEICKGARQDPEAIMFVDVGGGMGHEGLALKKRYPHLPGRFVNQDLPQVVTDQLLEGIESMAHDFLNQQPLKGKGLNSSCRHDFPRGVFVFGFAHQYH